MAVEETMTLANNAGQIRHPNAKTKNLNLSAKPHKKLIKAGQWWRL